MPRNGILPNWKHAAAEAVSPAGQEWDSLERQLEHMGPHVSGRWQSATASHAHAASSRSRRHGLEIPRRLAVLPKPLLRSVPFRIPSAPQQPGDHLHHHHHHHHHHQAMDAFPDGDFVRLESYWVSGKFVHADEDWEKISLRRINGAAPAGNSVWRVQHRVGQGYAYVLLQNAAFGRYLSCSARKAPFGQRGFRTVQRNPSEPSNAGFDPRLQPYPWMWTVQRLPRPDEACVSLRYTTCYLCANSKLFSGTNRVTADRDPLPGARRIVDMMRWKVHTVAASRVPRHLPLTLEDQEDDSLNPPRTIRHVQANDEGEFDQNHHNWPSFAFVGSSVDELKNQLRLRQHWNDDTPAYTLCMRPGSHGRLMPLTTYDLPRSLDSMNIVVFRTVSQAAAELQYPEPPAVAANVRSVLELSQR